MESSSAALAPPRSKMHVLKNPAPGGCHLYETRLVCDTAPHDHTRRTWHASTPKTGHSTPTRYSLFHAYSWKIRYRQATLSSGSIRSGTRVRSWAVCSARPSPPLPPQLARLASQLHRRCPPPAPRSTRASRQHKKGKTRPRSPPRPTPPRSPPRSLARSRRDHNVILCRDEIEGGFALRPPPSRLPLVPSCRRDEVGDRGR